MPRRSPRSLLRTSRDESGQVFALLAVALVVLLGMTALVLDLGYAYYVKRSLQASADAAATAGATELPDASAAVSRAQQYSGSHGGKNERGNLPPVATSVAVKCLSRAPCNPVNALVVRQTAEVQTLFARVVGIDTLKVGARATACAPCAARPLDIMLVLDRTGSMCMDHFGNLDPACTDLGNALNGMRTFLRFMDPEQVSIGLAVFPPATSLAARCDKPLDWASYDSPSSIYAIVPLSTDYLADGELNGSSDLVSTIGCQLGGGATSYANAIEVAQSELDLHGRDDVQDVIVFLSDGAANYGGTYHGASSPYRLQPCRQGIRSAAAVKARGTLIYTIGYDLDALDGGANVCRASSGVLERPAISAYEALQQIASGPEAFYNHPGPGELRTIFTQIASEVSGTRLIPDDDS